MSNIVSSEMRKQITDKIPDEKRLMEHEFSKKIEENFTDIQLDHIYEILTTTAFARIYNDITVILWEAMNSDHSFSEKELEATFSNNKEITELLNASLSELALGRRSLAYIVNTLTAKYSQADCSILKT